MEEDAGPEPHGAEGCPPFPPDRSTPSSRPFTPPTSPSPRTFRAPVAVLVLPLIVSACGHAPTVDALTRVQSSRTLSYASDEEGGGPYAYPDPDAPRAVTGFEVDLMRSIAHDLGAEPKFAQGQWDRLLQNLDAGLVDTVVNGYEWTDSRGRNYLATRPYYVYQLQLVAPRDGRLAAWDGVKAAGPGGRKWRVGVLVQSAGDTFAHEQGGAAVEVVRFDGTTDALAAVANGQIDATLQDLPAALFYRDRYPSLQFAGPPVGRGYYVMYFRRGDAPLRDAVDRALGGLIASGELRRLYERYGIWNDAQAELVGLSVDSLKVTTPAGASGFALVRQYAPLLIDATYVTVVLSVASMPLAMLIGLFVALGRLYGPAPLRLLLKVYVEVLRGTPLMLQLYVLFYVLKLPRWVAGIGGLAINYSAYESEIYRAGLQAIPPGQMEAALALGMSRAMALRRVIVPQAVRIVIPPITNDFIALFKDTSVCSVITLIELTKEYSILANSTGGVVEFAAATALLYMALSVPLSWVARWSERRLSASGATGGGLV